LPGPFGQTLRGAKGMGEFYRNVMWRIDQMDIQEWLVVFVCVIAVGVLCLRGFGSRSDY